MGATSDNLYARISARLGAMIIAIIIGSGASAALAQETVLPKGMKRVEGKYHYLMYDLSDDQAREAMLRMEAMVDEYLDRTRDFSGRLGGGKLPFMLFRREEDYHRAGGMPDTAGVFDGKQLLAIAGEKLNAETWHTIQHEGFHQFAHAVMGGGMPIWVNEGLAEYFGEAVFTGDGFVSGAIPAYRLDRVRKSINGKQFKSIDAMLQLSHREWNNEMSAMNYDQAWAMVAFLAHGDDGKYQKAFGQFISQTGRGIPWENAWQATFGQRRGIEERMEAWWNSPQRDDAIEPYARAATQMLSSYLARATSQKDKFADIKELLAGIKQGTIRHNPNDLLPKGLANDCIELVAGLEQKRGVKFELTAVPVGQSRTLTQPAIVCRVPDGTTITGTFKLRTGNRVGVVEAKIERPKPTPATKPSR
ncbi:MAG: DUF1570 domain-containing protein [Burkholderiales bacterium]|nr:DUF1570 domain-containing protein [Phycisphaerae bacterium]